MGGFQGGSDDKFDDGSTSVKVYGVDDTPIGNVTDSLKTNVTNAAGASAVNIQDGGNTLTIDTLQLASTLGQKTMANSAAVVLASDQAPIPVTTQGSRADVIDNKLYSFAADINMVSGTTDNPIILLRNPIGSGKVVFIETITTGVALANKISIIKLFFNPTITTNGTTVTTVSRNIGGGASPAVALVGSLPTVSANGDYAENLVIGQATNSEILSTDYTIAVEPGNSILVTGQPNANNVLVSIHVVWLEE